MISLRCYTILKALSKTMTVFMFIAYILQDPQGGVSTAGWVLISKLEEQI